MYLIGATFFILLIQPCVGPRNKDFHRQLSESDLIREWHASYRSMLYFEGTGNRRLVDSWLGYMATIEDRPEFLKKMKSSHRSKRLRDYFGFNADLVKKSSLIRKTQRPALNLARWLDSNLFGCSMDVFSRIHEILNNIPLGTNYKGRYEDNINEVIHNCLHRYEDILNDGMNIISLDDRTMILAIYQLIPAYAIDLADPRQPITSLDVTKAIHCAAYRYLRRRKLFDRLGKIKWDLNELRWYIKEMYELEIGKSAETICGLMKSTLIDVLDLLSYLKKRGDLKGEPQYIYNEINFFKISCILSSNRGIDEGIYEMLRNTLI